MEMDRNEGGSSKKYFTIWVEKDEKVQLSEFYWYFVPLECFYHEYYWAHLLCFLPYTVQKVPEDAHGKWKKHILFVSLKLLLTTFTLLKTVLLPSTVVQRATSSTSTQWTWSRWRDLRPWPRPSARRWPAARCPSPRPFTSRCRCKALHSPTARGSKFQPRAAK